MSDNHEEVPALISKFRARWPLAFTWPKPRPLALHIFEDIYCAIHPSDARDPAWRCFPAARTISVALGQWCGSSEYLSACVYNADRYDLRGNTVGKVDALQAQYAKAELARRAELVRPKEVTLPQFPKPLISIIPEDHPYLRSIQPSIFGSDGKYYVKYRDFFGVKTESIDFDTEEEAEAYAEALQRDRRIRVHDHEDFETADKRWREIEEEEKTASKRRRRKG